MAFDKKDIKDRIVTGGNKYTPTNLPDFRIQLIPAPDSVTEAGTPINKALLQRYEDALDEIINLKPYAEDSDLNAHINNISNPHGVTKAQVGLSNVDNIKQATKTEFDAHKNDKINPHEVTKTQVGLGNVDNIKQAAKVDFDSHTGNKDNPHVVTKAQVGLGNVDNKSSATIRGEITAANIPSLNASKIDSGTFGTDRIPNLPTSKITSGRFIKDRLPTDAVYTADLPTIPSIPSVMTTTEGNTGTATTQRTINAANLKSIILNHSPAGSRPASDVSSWAKALNRPTYNKSDVGLSNVDNIKQATKTEFDSHINNKNNPHGVTGTQLGLGNELHANGSTMIIANNGSRDVNGYGNTIIGGEITSTGINNVAMGSYANVGPWAVAIGRESVATGNSSVAMGRTTQSKGTSSVAVGRDSLAGEDNTVAIGGIASATSVGSIAIGANSRAESESGVALGDWSLARGIYGVAVGRTARAEGSSSTAVGNGASASGNYSTALGYNTSTGTTSSMIRLGSTNLSLLQSNVKLSVTSDIRDKTDIEEVPKALDFIKDLNPITYVANDRDHYISDEQKETDTYQDYLMVEDYDKEAHSQGTKKGSRRRIGLSAQEVRDKLIEHYGSDNYANIVNDNFVEFEERGLDVPEDLENKLTMSYETMVPFLIKAIQEQQEQIEELKNKLN